MFQVGVCMCVCVCVSVCVCECVCVSILVPLHTRTLRNHAFCRLVERQTILESYSHMFVSEDSDYQSNFQNEAGGDNRWNCPEISNKAAHQITRLLRTG